MATGISGLERLFSRRGLYASVCFSGGVEVFAKDRQLSQGHVFRLQIYFPKPYKVIYVMYSIGEEQAHESPPTSFLVLWGKDSGKVVVWPRTLGEHFRRLLV